MSVRPHCCAHQDWGDTRSLLPVWRQRPPRPGLCVPRDSDQECRRAGCSPWSSGRSRATPSFLYHALLVVCPPRPRERVETGAPQLRSMGAGELPWKRPWDAPAWALWRRKGSRFQRKGNLVSGPSDSHSSLWPVCGEQGHGACCQEGGDGRRGAGLACLRGHCLHGALECPCAGPSLQTRPSGG